MLRWHHTECHQIWDPDVGIAGKLVKDIIAIVFQDLFNGHFDNLLHTEYSMDNLDCLSVENWLLQEDDYKTTDQCLQPRYEMTVSKTLSDCSNSSPLSPVCPLYGNTPVFGHHTPVIATSNSDETLNF